MDGCGYVNDDDDGDDDDDDEIALMLRFRFSAFCGPPCKMFEK